MKKALWTILFAMTCTLRLAAGEALWDGALDTVKLTWGDKLKDVSVKAEDGVLNISATSEGSSVTYVSVEIRVKPFVLGERSIAFDAWSDHPKTTDAFYVRLQDTKRRNILSFQQWGAPLKDKPETLFVMPGLANRPMKWESTEIKAQPADTADRVVFFIGARGDGKKMNLRIRNLEIPDGLTALPKREGSPIRAEGNGTMSAAALNGGTLTIDSNILDPGVVYVYAKIPFAGNIAGKKLVLNAATSAPGVVGAFYVRGYNAKKQCILSYASWDRQLKKEARTFTLTPGKNSSGLRWETERVKQDAPQELAALEFILGAKDQPKKQVSATISDIRLE